MRVFKLLILTILCLNFKAFCQTKKQPNVVVILADDIGLGDISYYRKKHTDNVILETKNIDKIAASGMIFTNAHSPAALCAPSRYSILTGNCTYRSPMPWGVWSSYAKSIFTPEQLTLGKLMQRKTYTTAFVGKWNMGSSFRDKNDPSKIYQIKEENGMETNVDISKIMAGGPNHNGFDYSFTLPSGIQNVPYAAYENNDWYPLKKDSKIEIITQENMSKIGVKLDKSEGMGDSNWDPHTIGPLLISKVTDFIAKNANKNDPFFLYYCTQAVHLPHSPPAEINGKKIAGTTPSAHMDMIKELDEQMGMIIAELKKQGQYENTVFIFTSDNGGLIEKATAASGHNPSDIYRGAKNQAYEGGHRVPFIVSWPAQIKGSQSSDEPVLGLDILATLAAITNQKIEDGQAADSYNLLPILKKEKGAKAHPFLMIQGGSNKEVIIIDNDWKLIMQVDKKDKTNVKRTPVALFNLKENLKEAENLNLINKPEFQAKVAELFAKYNETRDQQIPIGKHYK